MRRGNPFIVVLLLFLATAAPLAAQDEGERASYELGGYVKDLVSYTGDSPVGSGFDNLLHARINTKWYISEMLTAGLELRGRAYVGHSVSATPGFADMIRNTHDIANLDARPWSTASSVGYGEVDRLWIESMSGPWQITVGRQRIAWGTNLVWNIIDLFNPQNVLDFDYEERPGVDAVRLQCYTSPVTKIEAAVKPGTTGQTTMVAGKLTGNRWDYDFHLMAAANNGRWIGGAAWAGDLWGAGFRGEVTITGINDDLRRAVQIDSSITGVVSAALSFDYTFPSSLYLHAEGLYNELGRTRDAAAFRAQSLLMNMRSPARWSAYGEIARDISPLVRASIFAIANPTDGSFVVAPTATWSVVTNLDAMFIALLFGGTEGTEFGKLGETGSVRVKFSF